MGQLQCVIFKRLSIAAFIVDISGTNQLSRRFHKILFTTNPLIFPSRPVRMLYDNDGVIHYERERHFLAESIISNFGEGLCMPTVAAKECSH